MFTHWSNGIKHLKTCSIKTSTNLQKQSVCPKQKKCFKMFYRMFDRVQILHNTLKRTYTKHGPQGPGPPLWNRSMGPYMDPVHGPPMWTPPYFVKLQAEKSSDEREKRYSHLSGEFKLEPMTTIYVTAFNIYITTVYTELTE